MATSALFLAVALAQGPVWEFVTGAHGTTPVARHEASLTEFDGALYLIGGRGHRPVDRFDPATGAWTSLGYPPFEMHHLQPVAFGDRLWILGAFTGGYPNETAIGDVWTYLPASDTWEIAASIPPARRRGSAGVAVSGGAIWVVGGNTKGHDGGYVPWFDRFDPATGAWTVMPDAPHARDHFTAVVVGNRLFAAGGRQTRLPNPFLHTVGPVDVFDFSSGTWASAPVPIPTERAGTMTVASGPHVVVIGGESASAAHREVEALDTSTGNWQSLPPLIQGRHSGGAAIHGVLIHCACGAGAPGGSPELSTHESLALDGLFGVDPENLLVNGDFQAGLLGWTSGGQVGTSPMGNVAAPALEVFSGFASQQVAAAPFEVYTLRGVHRVGGGTGSITIEALDVGDAVLATESLALPATSSFTSFEMRIVTPYRTDRLRIRVHAPGPAVTLVDDLVLVVTPGEVPRFGNPANPFALPPTGQAPTLGGVWTPSIDHSTFVPGAVADVLAIGVVPVNVPTDLGTLLFDPATSIVFTGPPSVPFQVPIPFDPALLGLRLVAQGASGAGAGVLLTNALDLTIKAP